MLDAVDLWKENFIFNPDYSSESDESFENQLKVIDFQMIMLGFTQIFLKTTKTINEMSRKTKNFLKLLAIVIVMVMVFMELGVIAIPALAAYKFWLVIIAFCIALIAS
jgi:hypothetical protein